MASTFSQSVFARSLYEDSAENKVDSSKNTEANFPITLPKVLPTDPKASSLHKPQEQQPNIIPSKEEDKKPVINSMKLPSIPAPGTDNINESHIPRGYWKHPAVDKIAKRLHDQAPSDRTWSRMVSNLFAFISIQFLNRYLPNTTAVKVVSWILQALLLFNLLESVWQFVRPQPTFDDLQLTPLQRKLMGLPEGGSTSGKHLTPPRYRPNFSPSRKVENVKSPVRSTTWA
ncbi:Nucleoporin Pom34 [Schizosaccharomyces pombe]